MKKANINSLLTLIVLLLTVLPTVEVKASTAWTVNPSDYRYDMLLYFDVESSASGPLDYSRYEFAAFCDDECRGVAEAISLPDGNDVLSMRIRSNSQNGETITFRYRDLSTSEEEQIEGVNLPFEADSRIGMPSNPYKMKIVQYFNVEISFDSDGGTVDVENGRYPEGTQLTITATPSEGHSFSGWSDGSTENPRIITVGGNVDFTAIFEVNSYKLTYTVDGESYKELDVEYGTTIVPETLPTKTGYTFHGWEGLPDDLTMPAEDVTVTGYYTINQYTLTFQTADGVVSSEKVDYNSAITPPTPPVKTGHTFAEWVGLPESMTMPAEDLTVNGTYTVNKYKLKYIVDNADYKEFDVEYGSAISPEEEPTKTGYTFSGWNGLPDGLIMPADNVEVSGSFTINTYNITYKIDGEDYKIVSIVYASAITPEEEPSKTGHTFSGWEGLPDDLIMPADDIVVTGTFTVNNYDIVYVVDGQDYKTVPTPFGSTVVPEPDPVKEGHSFSGWSGLPETMPAETVTATGSFYINSYNLTFKIGDDVVSSSVVEFASAISAPDAPEKEGHSFAGWEGLPESMTMPASDLTVTGSYTVNDYDIVYVVDGQDYKTVPTPFGSTVVPEPEPVKEGHSFSGWSGLPETMPAETVTATGSFSINSYNLTFKIGDDVIESSVVEFASEISVPDAPEKEGHTFSGWEGLPESMTMPASDLTVTGSYSVNNYDIVYVVDGQDYKTVPTPFGSTVVPEPDPVKEGHSFSGWSGLPETMPAETVTVTGSFSINTYTVTFKIGDDVVEISQVTFGDEIPIPDAPDKEGHTFDGWQNVPETMPAEDITIIGLYTVNSYKLTYVVDGETYKEVDVDYGTEIVPEDAPEKEGHTFSGWEGIPETMPANDVTVTGTFIVNTYLLTVYLDEKVYLEEELEFGAQISIPEPELPDDRKFNGWQEEVPETMPAHDVEIHGTTTSVGAVISAICDVNGRVDIFTVSGYPVFRNADLEEVAGKLTPGVYIINGKKVLIK